LRPTPSSTFCGGVVISPWNVLTAAHCMFSSAKEDGSRPRYDPGDIGVRLGNVTLRSALTGKVYEIQKIYVHPDYDSRTLENDIAMIALVEKIRVGSRINPVCLPEQNSEVIQVLNGEWRTFPCRISL
jgi:trypsin